jgi:glutamate-5-semialdehyde dehydrogenase
MTGMTEPIDFAQRAKAASKLLALVTTAQKNAWLLASAKALGDHTTRILDANAKDIAASSSLGLNSAAIDRLTQNANRIAGMAEGLRQVASLPDPVGEVREGSTRPNGLQVLKVGVPIGVIFFLYESRPNVTADAAALCVKSGNAVILRGGKEAAHTNTAIHAILTADLPAFGLPVDCVQLTHGDRDSVGQFLKLDSLIDLVIPRGGESLIRRVVAEATMPVLKHYRGNCHVYVDAAADLEKAIAIVVNSKTHRPGVCNAAESLLVHESIAKAFLPRLDRAWAEKTVEIRGCSKTLAILPRAIPATVLDFETEFLDLIIAAKVVSSCDEAIEHINRYGSKHTDAIVTQDIETAQKFSKSVDSAAVIINASTRFHDGFELGLGAEIGISTDKFHARGPCGLRELTTTKYLITGSGQIR